MLQRDSFHNLEKALQYKFKRPELFFQAFRHSSYVNEQDDPSLKDNERLEFLGDAVLDLAISHILMNLFPDMEEGFLSKYRAMLVDESGLCDVASKLRLGDYLFLGKGEERSHGREKSSILANTLEALLGSIYLDAGFEKTLKIIRRLFAPLLEKLGTQALVHDYKSLLQEYTQQVYKTLPEYSLVKENGPPHDRIFKVALSLNGKVIAEAEGKSKKEAEQKAAEESYFCLKNG